MSDDWGADMKRYVTARREAGTAKGIAFAERLAAMPAAEAAAEIRDMFCLCAPEDLADEIACDLQLDFAVAERIAAAMAPKHY